MAQFWSDVLAGLISTIAGVALGIPVGIWLNSKAQASAEGMADAERKAKAAHVLSIARETVQQNVNTLREEKRIVESERLAVSVTLQTATWDAISDDVFLLLPSPEQRKALAEHFSQVAQWRTLNELYFSYNYGVLCSYSSSKDMKPVVKKLLVGLADRIITSSEQLLAEIDTTAKS